MQYHHVQMKACSVYLVKPVKYKIDFKVLLLVFKAMNGLTLLSISNLLCPYYKSRPLSSVEKLLLTGP